MAKRLLIDAVHPEEVRVAALDGERLVTVDVDTREGGQLAGNLYVASVARVEASLQAAFVDYGGERHGFLPFSEIHPDYFQLPEVDRPEPSRTAPEAEGDDASENGAESEDSGGEAEAAAPESGEEASQAAGARRGKRRRNYAIQEVIRNRQVLLVQVHKEPRGDKGAALTTYLSLAGRYCVLMPNADRGGGVSRKISVEDRKRLREIAGELDVAKGHGVIIRTAGSSRTRPEIKRDYAALLKQWDEIRSRALSVEAPILIHEESNLIRRAVRDFYDRDTTEILIEGEEAYQDARRHMRMLTPSHVKNVKQYNKASRDGPLPPDSPPIFHQFGVERQLAELFSARVTLPSGGSIVIHPTEALTAIDVNSGRSTGERNIEETAYRTNLEAADAVARQLRLRDISGLVVVDFIDMIEDRNRHAVERRLRDRLRSDYSRTQVGKISAFGLLEMSRQRLARSLVEISTVPCRTCEGGRVRSPVSSGLGLLRRVEAEAGEKTGRTALVRAPAEVIEFLANGKRTDLAQVESRRGIRIHLRAETGTVSPEGEIVWRAADWDPVAEAMQGGRESSAEGARERRRRRNRNADGQRERGDEQRDSERKSRRGRRSRSGSAEAAEAGENAEAADAPSTRGRRRRRAQDDGVDAESAPPASAEGEGGEAAGRRRRRGRRSGRRRNEDAAVADEQAVSASDGDGAPEGEPSPEAEVESGDASRRRRRGRRGGRGRAQRRADPVDAPAEAGSENGDGGGESLARNEVPVEALPAADRIAPPEARDPQESAV